MVYVIQVCWHIPLLCVQWKTPDDGQRNCPKHAEFHSKNKFEKLVHLVAFIITNLTLCTVTWTSSIYLNDRTKPANGSHTPYVLTTRRFNINNGQLYLIQGSYLELPTPGSTIPVGAAHRLKLGVHYTGQCLLVRQACLEGRFREVNDIPPLILLKHL